MITNKMRILNILRVPTRDIKKTISSIQHKLKGIAELLPAYLAQASRENYPTVKDWVFESHKKYRINGRYLILISTCCRIFGIRAKCCRSIDPTTNQVYAYLQVCGLKGDLDICARILEVCFTYIEATPLHGSSITKKAVADITYNVLIVILENTRDHPNVHTRKHIVDNYAMRHLGKLNFDRRFDPSTVNLNKAISKTFKVHKLIA